MKIMSDDSYERLKQAAAERDYWRDRYQEIVLSAGLRGLEVEIKPAIPEHVVLRKSH